VIFRVATWASAGLLVSVAWGVYFASVSKAIPIEPIVYALAAVTQPSAAAALHLKGIDRAGLTSVAAANAGTYALFGLIAETIRRHYRSIHISD
jgi:hypothetical protein